MNPYLLAVLIILVVGTFLELTASWLNLSAVSEDLPEEFVGWYSQDRYGTSQRYLKATTKLAMFSELSGACAGIGFILLGGFNHVDLLARSLVSGPIFTGLVFTGVLLVMTSVISLPVKLYSTFVIEERFGFNRSTLKIFVLDQLKAAVLLVIIGAPILGIILFLFQVSGPWAWVFAWGSTTLIQLLLVYLAPSLIMPLFNKFNPLEEGPLRSSIEKFAVAHGFPLAGIYTMDGSKRSSKPNAFFTGLGKQKRIVLFDTLLKQHTNEEILAVLAHEMGHFKLGHIRKGLITGLMTTGLTFFLLSLTINNQGLFQAFQMEQLSIYASLTFFGYLFAPIGLVLGLLGKAVSRAHEHQADLFAAKTTGTPKNLVNALKRLSVESLSNLTPHSLNVTLRYSHPPVLVRIKKLRHAE
jgi:STE24 endopeptidase